MSARPAPSTWSISARATPCRRRFRSRNFVIHNPNVTLMRTTRDENRAIGEWIGARLSRMNGPVRFLLPEGGVSLLDAPGQPFHDPEADNALFEAIERDRSARAAARQVERVRGQHQRAGFRGGSARCVRRDHAADHRGKHEAASRQEVCGRSAGQVAWGSVILWLVVLAILVAIAVYLLALALSPLDQGDGFRPHRVPGREGGGQRRRLRRAGAARHHAGQHERHADRGAARASGRR